MARIDTTVQTVGIVDASTGSALTSTYAPQAETSPVFIKDSAAAWFVLADINTSQTPPIYTGLLVLEQDAAGRPIGFALQDTEENFPTTVLSPIQEFLEATEPTVLAVSQREE
jgi:hypothetical protein